MSSPRDARDEGWDEALLVWNGVEARIPAPPRRAFPPAEGVSAGAPNLDSPTLDHAGPRAFCAPGTNGPRTDALARTGRRSGGKWAQGEVAADDESGA